MAGCIHLFFQYSVIPWGHSGFSFGRQSSYLHWVLLANYGLNSRLPLPCYGVWGLQQLLHPYIWSWDFVLLLPIWISTFARVDWKRKLFLLTFYGVAWYGMALVQMQQAGDNSLFWWVPLCFIAVLVFVTDWKADWLGGNPTS